MCVMMCDVLFTVLRSRQVSCVSIDGRKNDPLLARRPTVLDLRKARAPSLPSTPVPMRAVSPSETCPYARAVAPCNLLRQRAVAPTDLELARSQLPKWVHKWLIGEQHGEQHGEQFGEQFGKQFGDCLFDGMF